MLLVQDPGNRGLDGAIRSLQSAIGHRITPFRDPALSYFGALGSTRKLIFWPHFHPWGSPGGWSGGGGHPNPLGHPVAAQGLASQNGPGSRLDTPNGTFKVGPKAGH